MRSYRIAILRHGRTAANEDGRIIGKTDLPLSEDGRKELEEKAALKEYPRVEQIYTSPLERAVQSADILFPDREITMVDDLREMDFGIFENMYITDAVKLDSYKRWLKGGLDNPPPNGEAPRAVMLRCYASLNAIIMDMMKRDILRAAIITHSGIIMNMLSCFGLPKLGAMEFTCEPGEGFEIAVNAMMWQNGRTFEITGRIPGGEAVGFNDAGELTGGYPAEEDIRPDFGNIPDDEYGEDYEDS